MSAPGDQIPQTGSVMTVIEYLANHYIELIGFVFGVIYVILVIREHYLCWVAGSINVIIYIVVFYHSNLYGMSLLQVFYLILSIYGFLLWKGIYKPKEQGRSVRVIRFMPGRMWWYLSLVFCVAALLTGYLLSHTNSPVPYMDGLTTMMGLAATWMTARKYIDSWLVWIINDLICVAVYLFLGLYLTAALYVVFFAMAIVGYFAWRKRMEAVAV